MFGGGGVKQDENKAPATGGLFAAKAGNMGSKPTEVSKSNLFGNADIKANPFGGSSGDQAQNPGMGSTSNILGGNLGLGLGGGENKPK